MAKIVIIGAGLTGLSAAHHLEKKGFFDYALFEKESVVGGLCRSITDNGFTFDFTGHWLHCSDTYFRNYLNELLPVEQRITVPRHSFIYSHGAYTRYPYQLNLYGLPTEVIAQCIEGFATRNRSRKTPRMFTEWVLTNFGTGFGKQFFFPYQQKIFAYDARKLTARWTGRFVPQTSLQRIIQGALTDIDDERIGYNAQLTYPRNGGIMTWIHALAAQLRNPIHTGFHAQHIDMVKHIVTFTNGHQEPFDHLITTMPLDLLLKSLREKPSTRLAPAAKKLRCNAVLNINLGLRTQALADGKQWVYFPEQQYPFYRLGFPHNVTETVVPQGCSSLYAEVSYLHASHRSVTQLEAQTLSAIKKLLGTSDADIITAPTLHIPHAYVIYNQWRDNNVPRILSRLEEQNIYSIGRYGAWKYASMQEAVLDGKTIADRLTVIPARQIHTTSYTRIKKPSIQKELS